LVALRKLSFDLEAPGTFVYTGPLSTRGERLNRFSLSLRIPENRSRFLAGERAYMAGFGLSEREIALVAGRDWTGLLKAGGHLQAILKIAATLGSDIWAIAAHNTGLSEAEIAEACPRHTVGLPTPAND
jgi:protocatechuate 4,5-dioxygenase alpha chain